MARLCLALAIFAALALRADAAEPVTGVLAGFAAVDITPRLHNRPVYLAGYGTGRRASGVHDPLFARTVVLQHERDRIAIACVDLIGLQYPQVKAIRAKLPEFRYVLVSSTHNHEGPDVIGIWGRGPFHRGVNNDYLDLVVERVVQSRKDEASRLAPVTAAYGIAEDESLLSDSRLPIVKDGVLRVVQLQAAAAKNDAGMANRGGLVVQWNCHPESLGARNREITADFPWATVA